MPESMPLDAIAPLSQVLGFTSDAAIDIVVAVVCLALIATASVLFGKRRSEVDNARS